MIEKYEYELRNVIDFALQDYVVTANGLPFTSVIPGLRMHLFNNISKWIDNPDHIVNVIREEQPADFPVEEKSVVEPLPINWDYVPIDIVLTRNAPLPEYATVDSSGFDLRAIYSTKDFYLNCNKFNKKENIDFYIADDGTDNIPIYILPHHSVPFLTGNSMKIPKGYELQLRPRSGNSIKLDITLANSPGTVDADYTGEILILVRNEGSIPVKIEYGMKLVQGVICPVAKAVFNIVDTLEKTDRGSGGFGSTDKTENDGLTKNIT